MQDLAKARIAGSIPEVLMLVEHEQVITLGRRARDEDLRVSRQELAARGIEVFEVERGGLATCHGPGQLVAYVIFHLPSLGLGVAEAVRRLEEAALTTLAEFGLAAERRQGHPGIWLGAEKIASLGLAVRRGVTFHGLALNYAQVPPAFDLVVPCGLSQARITCMSQALGRPVDQTLLRRRLVRGLAVQFGLDLRPWSLEEAQSAAEKASA